LTALGEMGVQVRSYTIIELSGELRARQQEALKDLPVVTWLDGMPESFSGVVLANEVLDAMPVELVIRKDGRWQRQMVTVENGAFTFVQQALPPALAAQVAREVPEAEHLPDGYVTEIHPVAEGFMGSLATMMKGGRGAAFLFDYGFPAHEYYLDQ